MIADEVRSALRQRWPEDRYHHIREAPLDAGRQGTKIDVLVVALWKSLRYELDAVEIKVSVADFRNELRTYTWVIDWPEGIESPKWLDLDHVYYGREPAAYYTRLYGGTVRRVASDSTEKSEQWRSHAHRFWIASPQAVAEKITPMLPAGWGLLGIHDDGNSSVLVRPAKNRNPDALTWPESVGLMRACADAGRAAIERAEHRGAESIRAMLERAVSGG